MKIIRNKFVIGLLCIAIGITVGFVLLPKSQENEAAMAQAVRVQTDIKAGTRLEEAMLETVSVPAASLPSGAHAALESFLGRYAATSLFAGDILTEAKVRDTLADPVAAGAAKGKQLVSVTMPLALRRCFRPAAPRRCGVRDGDEQGDAVQPAARPAGGHRTDGHSP